MQEGQGTGFVVSEDGYIVTNHHVVGEADEVRVRLPDGESFEATVVGTDSKTDIAVLKINANDLTPVMLGDSEDLHVGEWVVAAGTPFGLTSTITAGIVSAKGRSRMGFADYEDFIQTDAAINPGNSGGPLVNLRGEVVGVNTAIFSKSGGHNGIGFAIPVNLARNIMERLIEDGHIVRGWLGVYIQNLDDGLARSFGFDGTHGALVGDLPEHSPAADAGIQVGDILTHMNGEEIANVERLRLDIAATRPGTEVTFTVYRDGVTETVHVEIGELEGDQLSRSGLKEKLDSKLGLTLKDLSPDLKQQLGIPPSQSGLLVAQVEPFSPAARAGMRPRDVIIEIQGELVGDMADFRRILSQHNLEQGVRLTVQNGDNQRFVFLKSK